MHRGREDIVGALAEIHVVVGVHVGAGEIGNDLVRVHVGRGSRPGLEDVDRELVIVLAGRDLVGRSDDPRGDALIEQTEFEVG